MQSLHVLDVSTSRPCELVDITSRVEELVRGSGANTGLCTVFSPHTTAAVTLNENADPDVQQDLLFALERAVPNRGFRHSEGNSDAHVKTSLVGPSVTLLIEGGELKLGRWQAVFLCEFDGPRQRKLWVQVLPG
jgi:secondary thiamine-phosphate synthase enzyme